MTTRRGTTFIDLLVSLAIIAALFAGVYLVYFSLITSATSIALRAAATALINQELETIRNMPYDSVGTVGGIPSGIIPQTQTVSFGNTPFSIATTIRNIDDPFDGTLGGNPNDTAPADYKLVSVSANCISCQHFSPVMITATVAPKNLESATTNGSLFISVIDANGNGVSGASVHVTNSIIVPSIDLADMTNVSGALQLVGVPTSTSQYHIVVSKSQYSGDQTYPLGVQANPNPTKPDATVAAQVVTSETFSIDKVSTVNVHTSNNVCVPVGNKSFTMQGSKLIGMNPNVLKFSTSSATDASGTATISDVEWDTYTVTLSDAAYDVLGTIPLSPFVISPNSALDFRFVLMPAANPSLLTTITDTNGNGLQDATTTLSRAGFFGTQTTGHAFLTQSDWSNKNYSSKDDGIDASSPGKLTLLSNASSTYSTSTTSLLISNTLDTGGTSTVFYALSWNPVSQAPQTGADSLRVQLAANNDNVTWNFVGPDATANTFFTTSGTKIPQVLSDNRYMRYKIFMTTADENTTPELDNISIEFSGVCVPPAQVLFQNLAQDTYTLDVMKAGYAEASTSIDIGSGSQSIAVPLTAL